MNGPRYQRPTSAPSIAGEAERIVYRAKWRLRETEAAERLVHTHGVVSTPLFPPSPVIQIVAFEGHVIGRVRREGGRWIAARDSAPIARCDRFEAAVQALVHAACDG